MSERESKRERQKQTKSQIERKQILHKAERSERNLWKLVKC